MRRCWAILTGAYPPAPGGASDYTHVIALALADAGDDVHVFAANAHTPGRDATLRALNHPRVRVRIVPEGFTIAGFGALADEVERLPAHREILVQYTPYAFARDWGAPNVALPLWLLMRSRRERIIVMFHEVMFPVRAGQPLRHNLLGRAHRAIARILARAATRILVATPRWGEILRVECGATTPIEWAPVPSNLPTAVDPLRVALARRDLVTPDQVLIGHFGTYGPLIAPMLEPIIVGVLRLDLRCRVLLAGRGSREFARQVIAGHPAVEERLLATGELDPTPLAEHLSTCDLLVQPYPDGITTRRSSAMAGLGLGVPVVTNAGELTEPLWGSSRSVALARDPSPSAIIERVGQLLADDSARRAIAQCGRALYRERFAVERTVEIVRRRAEC